MEIRKIYIPNLSIGNTSSVVNMINKLGGEVIIVDKPEDLLAAEKIILPGVGSFDVGIKELHNGGWVEIMNKLVLSDKVPVLGICLGMQFFFDSSEEGVSSGLGWIPGKLVKFSSTTEKPIKIPHMGWNAVKIHKEDGLIPLIDDEIRYYFVHSYHAICDNKADLVATAYHGSDVTAAVQHNNIYGVQFHPEKSHKFGMALLKNYLAL